MKLHIKSTHEENDKGYKCEVCKKQYKLKSGLTRHNRVTCEKNHEEKIPLKCDALSMFYKQRL